MTILKKSVSLNPGESKAVGFEFTPAEAGIYQVSVDGLTGSFVTVAIPKGTLVGGVFIAGTGPNWVPVAGATVEAVGPYPSTASRTTTTKSDGSYSISNLEPGGYDVHFSKSGYESYYEPVTIEAGETADLSVALTPITPPFDPWSYDLNGNGIIDTSEMLAAVNDYYAGIITKAQVDQVIALWEATKPPPPPTPPPPPPPPPEGEMAPTPPPYGPFMG